MKITCPKCHSSYRVDLPDSSEAGIEVQCGKCLYIFQFSPDIEKTSSGEVQKDASVKTRDSDLPENSFSEPILPPQKDEDQEVSDSEKQPLQSKIQASDSQEKDREIPEELKIESPLDEPETIEFIIENEPPDDSLEAESLDNIWNQAMQEGARTTDKPKEEPPLPPPGKLIEDSIEEETREQKSPAEDKILDQPPSLEDRQQEIDQIITDPRPKQGEPEEEPQAEKSPPSPTHTDSQTEKPQEEIDLEEQVTVNEEEAAVSWEDAFAHQSEVESGWKKAQEQDRIQEEQQLAEALSKKTLPEEPGTEEKATPEPQEDTQSLVDEIFAQAKGSQESSEEKAESPQLDSEADQKPDEVDPTLSETQEEIDLEEQVTVDEAEAIPSWEEAFAHQAEVEAGWKIAQQKDRIHEEQQLAEALGEAYQPSDTPAEGPADKTPQENKQSLVDELFAEVRSQQEPPEPLEEQTQDAPLGEPGEEAPTPESEEVHIDQYTVPDGIDLMSDLDDLNMKQMVDPAFRKESESQEKTGSSIPEDITVKSEETQEPPLTMEDSTEINQEIEPPPEEPILELEMESTLEPTEDEPEPAETAAQEEESEIELELEIESPQDTAETPIETEPTLPEPPLEIEPEPEPAMSQESLEDEGSEELWNDLQPEQNEEEQPVNEEAPVAFSKKNEEEEPFGGDDFWDQVLEKDSQEPQTTEPEAQPQPVAFTPMPLDTEQRKNLTDEELWKQAFPNDEELEPTASQYSGEEEQDSQSKIAPLTIGASNQLNDESKDTLEYDEAAYADFDDDELEFQHRKRKLGPFTLPHGLRGDLVLGGVIVVFLLLAGGIYFTLQTFAPGELTDIQKAETEVPEGLTPGKPPSDETAQDLITPAPQPEKIPPVDTPGDKGEATLSEPSEILKESPEEQGILKDLAESQILRDTGKSQTAKIDQSALQALAGHSVTMSTIMPVAYNSTDIRVLSFSVEMQLSDARSAKMVRESLPVYEEIMNQTVENFLRRKFYNDILYVKEKLQKRLQTAMNKSLKNGRVKKTKFVDFAIQ